MGKIAYLAGEGYQDPDLGYAVAIVEEDVPGWSRWAYLPTLEWAEATASEGNKALGLSPEDVKHILWSSIRASQLADAARETITATIEVRVTDDALDGIISTGELGIAYWAEEITEDEASTLDKEAVMVFTEVDGYDRTPRGVSYMALREAVALALDPLSNVGFSDTARRQVVSAIRSPEADGGLDAAEIDAQGADELVQVAALGEVIYG